MPKKKMYLYGKNSVLERLKFDPGSIRQIFIQDNFKSTEIVKLITSEKIPIKRVSERELVRIKRADRLQGIVAEIGTFTYTHFDDILNKGIEQGLTFIFLDGLNDPHNLGSIMRTAACFGGFALIIPEHGSCDVNDTVVHVASGGENFVPVSMVTNLSAALLKAKKAGYWAVGTVVSEGEDINSTSLLFPMCLVMGTEGKGIRYGIQKHLDLKITLPMKGAQLSLNVAIAFAICAQEITRQHSTS
ncbi:MAG: 23S rRNA (guanosine(2251)-2'-O)-methyltransferase RlmB [Nitrospiraceae bacterium]|nr:MAG: 23S rRNA (guanosine(2251)-2'-O)-methyltransferase RlmB [Nitrospiraceae bacterium]